MHPIIPCAMIAWVAAPTGALADRLVAPLHRASGAARVWVSDSHNVSERAARETVGTVLAAVTTCLRDAHARDPAGLAAMHAAVAVLRFARDGSASTVHLAPSDLPHGLSACLATALLAWHQPGRIGLRATVQLTVSLDP